MRAWSFLHMGGLSQFEGNLGYTDRIDRFYEWDSTVANHGRVDERDLAVLRDANHLLGLGWLERIEHEPNVPKVRRRCPRCGSTGFKRRSTLRPPFRCSRCRAEFTEPSEEEVRVTRSVGHYGSSWWPLLTPVNRRAAAAIYLSKAHQHSIREVDAGRLRELLERRATGPPDVWWRR
jgi:hypothetical protein